jgi:hypothetical protein
VKGKEAKEMDGLFANNPKMNDFVWNEKGKANAQ